MNQRGRPRVGPQPSGARSDWPRIKKKREKEKDVKERREESNVSKDRARGLREDTRQASGFGVAACKTTERYPSAFRRFDPVGFCLPVCRSPSKSVGTTPNILIKLWQNEQIIIVTFTLISRVK